MFDKPDYAAGRPGDAAWYKDREGSDHINEPGHRQRLLQATDLILERFDYGKATRVSDFGAGNGGLLHEVKERNQSISCWGYDMCPWNVKWANEKYGVYVRCLDVTVWDERIEYGDCVVLTEFLEHLVDPHGLVAGILSRREVLSVVASVPGFEDPRKPYEYHLWCWHGSSFADMFTRIGWKVQRHFFRADCGTQFLVASR